ncbi:MAG TPA: methylenetetrahydrofolate reductase [Candidatus Binataceae bacterium]|nr:methylenetetrahydrofolate reductase [Candidatus Binataceae bacterium]
MSALLKRLDARTPALWLEVAPPRGIAVESMLARLAAVRGHVDAINLADNALGRVKLAPLVFGSLIKSRLEMAVAINFSCRDRNRYALKADLLGAGALGIDAVVALTGDKLAADPNGARPVHDLDTFSLLRVMGDLRRGDTGEGRRLLKTLPQFALGAVANPNRKAIEREFELLERKALAGAEFVITQPVFDLAVARAFIARARGHKLRVVLGILPVKRESMADYLKDRIPDLASAHAHFDRYAGLGEAEARRMSIDSSLELMRALAEEVAGFNIMSGGGPSLAIELALEFSRSLEDSGAR